MLPAEWEPQRFVQLTWPHADTDWAPYLDAAQECFLNIARAITLHEPLLVVTPTPEDVEAQLREGGVDMSQVVIEECPTNDTWARDHAFICTREPDKIGGSTDDYVEGGGNIILHDFTFNGWGMKFAANLDNQINRTIYDDDTFADNDILDIWARLKATARGPSSQPPNVCSRPTEISSRANHRSSVGSSTTLAHSVSFGSTMASSWVTTPTPTSTPWPDSAPTTPSSM